MAIILPGDLPSGDTRAIYDKDHLPGGPWNRYRPVQWVNAVRLTGPWLLRLPDGRLSEQSPGWAISDPTTGSMSLMTPEQFANSYVLEH